MSVSPTPSDSSSQSEINLTAPDDCIIGRLSPRFDKHSHDSDLILRSCDNVLFRVHKARLMGSGVFRDMLEIGSELEPDLEGYREPATVCLSEDAQTLENILPFFYDEFPNVDGMEFDEVLKAFEASLKYSMSLVEHIYSARLRRMMPDQLLADQAFQLWKLCSTLDRPDLAAQALPLTAKGNIMLFSIADISSLHNRDLDTLWRTHMRQSQNAADMLFKYSWQSARGNCYFFNVAEHEAYMRSLLLAKSSGMSCSKPVPLGFETCSKCGVMASELGLTSSY